MGTCMRRVLVIYPKVGFLDLIKAVLAGINEVDTTDNLDHALKRLNPDKIYDVVICGIHQPDRAIELFEKSLELSVVTRLIPVASNEAEILKFREKWTRDAKT